MKKSYSYSKILDYATCPQKYYLRNVLKLQPTKKAKPLSFGHCTSKGIEAYRLTGSVDQAQKAFEAAWEDDGKVLLIESDPDNPKDFRTVKRGLQLMKEYAEEYPDDPMQVVGSNKPDGERGTEIKFEDVFLGIINQVKIYLRGRIDGIFKINEDIYIVEDKTTSRLGETYIPILRDSMQINIYLWVANILGLFSVGDKRKTPKCLMNAMRVHPTEFKFKRDVAIKSRPHLELAKQNALWWIDRIMKSEEDGCFPMNDIDNSTCTQYGGCDFLPLRYIEGSLRDSILKNEFEVKKPREEVKKNEKNESNVRGRK